MAETAGDDRLTIAAVAALAWALQDILHEGVGHGITAWLSGANRLTMSTVALSSDNASRWISANGTLVNLLFAALVWLVLRRADRFQPVTRYFLVLVLMGNLFTGTGYFLFSGVMDFGDWAAVIQGLEPHWAWRAGLIVLGAASYYGSMLLVSAELASFREKSGWSPRLRRLCWLPYFTDGALAAAGGLMNPLGLFYVVASALPSTLGANAGLLNMPSFTCPWRPAPEKQPVSPLPRSIGWIATAAVVSLLFVFVLGRGLTWSR